MPQPPPPIEGCLRAWELYSQHYPWRHVAELLRAEGYDGHDLARWPKCGSHETARQWGMKGKELSYVRDALDRGGGRARMVAGLEQDMASLRELVRVSEGEHLLKVMDHLKWMYRELARLIGTDAPPQPQHLVLSGDQSLSPDPDIAVQVREALAEAEAEEQRLRRNGR